MNVTLPRATRLLCTVLLALAATAGRLKAEDITTETAISDIDREHWAFQPIQRSDLPSVSDSNWCRTAVDRFILAKLEKKSLSPLPEAGRLTLIRRVTFDLTGLPPTPSDVDDFLNDPHPDAYERLIDRLLQSPGYGERWGRYWLDLARYAETDGFEFDHTRPDAWRYRDWVIGALNADLPYDQFLSEQIAGDQISPGNLSAAIATGFLLCGPDMTDINLLEERRHTFLNGMTATVGEVFLGLQFGCAQCHDHKADPISIHDFYRLRAYFDSIDLFKNHSADPDAENNGDQKSSPALRIVRDSATAVESFVRVRGDFRRQGPVVQPGVPRIAWTSPADDNAPRRADLTVWMISPRNPLTSRVIVNRIWQQHFGVGLCETGSDFGLLGASPTHPELLDWLAAELMRRGWSLKQFHRLLVTSSVYRTDSFPTETSRPIWEAIVAADPDNELLGRMRRRRLDAEEIRDAMLSASGLLNQKAEGPGVSPPLPQEVVQTLLKKQWTVSEDPGDHRRRSVYLFVRRNLRYPLFEVFDQPDSNQSCARRVRTTIAPQALCLLNSDFSLQCARALATRVSSQSRQPEEQIHAAYRYVLGRAPADGELIAALQLLADGEADGLEDLCLALLNLNESVYLD